MTSDGFRNYRPDRVEGMFVRTPARQVGNILAIQNGKIYVIASKVSDLISEEYGAIARYLEKIGEGKQNPLFIEDSELVGELVRDPESVKKYDLEEHFKQNKKGSKS